MVGKDKSNVSSSADTSSSNAQDAQHAAASASEAPAQQASAVTDTAEAEDPNECGWCKWMKAGGCKAEFEVWLKCVDDVRDAGRDDVESCASVMGPLWACMQKNSDYYAPQLEHLKNAKPEGSEDGSGEAKEKSSGVVQMAVEVVEELEEMVESVLGRDDDN